MSMLNDPRGPGDNTQTVNYMEDEIARLRSEYPHLEPLVKGLEEEGDRITVVDSPETKDLVKSLIKRMRDAYKRVQGVHEPEKMPHLERGRGVDSFCFGLMDRLGRRDKKAREGAADRLNRLLTDYDVQVEAALREQQRLEAEAALRKAREAEEARKKLEREAEEARLAAERARKPETQAVKAEVAEQKEVAASQAIVEANVAAVRAEEAYQGTLKTSADLMRERSQDGIQSTMAMEKFAEVTDRALLDLNRLRPYIPMPALETALRKYADSVGYSSDDSVQIAGARFGKKPKSRVL